MSFKGKWLTRWNYCLVSWVLICLPINVTVHMCQVQLKVTSTVSCPPGTPLLMPEADDKPMSSDTPRNKYVLERKESKMGRLNRSRPKVKEETQDLRPEWRWGTSHANHSAKSSPGKNTQCGNISAWLENSRKSMWQRDPEGRTPSKQELSPWIYFELYEESQKAHAHIARICLHIKYTHWGMVCWCVLTWWNDYMLISMFFTSHSFLIVRTFIIYSLSSFIVTRYSNHPVPDSHWTALS